MPNLAQLQHFCRLRRRSEGLHSINAVVDLIKSSYSNLLDNKPILFGAKFDELSEPVVGNGRSSDETFRLGVTSLRLLKRIPSKACTKYASHIDCTHKVTKNGFPLCVFGYSDNSGQFFPVFFAIMSHESENDFIWFFSSCLAVLKLHSIAPDFDFIMIDAKDATFYAAASIFPNARLLVCYFHVVTNVKKNKDKLPKGSKRAEIYEKVKEDVDYLRCSMHQSEFSQRLTEVIARWDAMQLDEFKEYFLKQWVNSRWNTWLLFYLMPSCGHKLHNRKLQQTLKNFFFNVFKILYLFF